MKPFPFQNECVRAAEQFGGRALFSLDMGLGKSACSLWYAERNNAFPMIIVCPASLKWQWAAEVRKVLNLSAHVCEGTRPTAVDGSVLIINYDILRGWMPVLRAMKPKLIVPDECQYIMNPKAQRTKLVRELCRGVRHVLALSGTPLVNRPIELWPTLNLLRPSLFPSRFKFGVQYCAGRRNYWGWEFKGASRTQELHRLLLDSCMIRRRKQEVLDQLPDKIRQAVPVDMKESEAYREAEADFLGYLANIDPEAAERAARAEAISRAGYLLRLAARLKCRAVVDWINEWLRETDEKLLVFCVHRKMIEALTRRIASGCVHVDGGVVGKDRDRAVKIFETDPSIRVLVGNVQAAGVGLNLTAASAVAFAELPWHPAAVTQAEDRAHRIGQRRCVNVYYLVARNTVEERRCEVICRKQETVAAVLDGGEGGDGLDVFDEFLFGVKAARQQE